MSDRTCLSCSRSVPPKRSYFGKCHTCHVRLLRSIDPAFRQKCLAASKRYQLKHSDRVSASKRTYYQKHKTRHLAAVKAYAAKRKLIDPDYKMRLALRSRMYDVLRGRRRSGVAVELLGCSVAELRCYLEEQFVDGMSWDNWGRKGWHIDHIRPLSTFDLTDLEQLKVACNYKNLRPIWWYLNLSRRRSDATRPRTVR